MSKELSVPLTPNTAAVAAPARASNWLQAGGIVLAGSALAAVCAHVAVPLFFTPVPLTLQPFAVLLLGLLLTPRLAAATFAAYLLEGAIGLPVFAPSPAVSGLAHLFGPTGGYLLAYPFVAALISFLWRRTRQGNGLGTGHGTRPENGRKTGRGFAAALVSAALGDAVILACGAVWLALLAHVAVFHAAALAVFPFLPGDALKIVAAAALAAGWTRLRRRRSDPALENN